MKKGIKTGIAIVLLTGVLMAFAVPADKYFEIARSLDIFATLFKEVNTYYVDDIEPKKLVDTSIHGMLESLDPYTDYIPEEDIEAFTIQTTGQYAGIGALVGVVNNKTVIRYAYETFPAHRAGLQVGDEFIAVDGTDMRGKPSSDISNKLKGKPNTPVEVTVRRYKQEITVKLNRERIKISNIAYQGVLAGNIGYIKLDEFTPGATQEVESALQNLKKAGATSFILDLRDNPGGLLHEAINITNLFLPKSKPVVSTKGKVADWNKTYSTLNAPFDTTIPLVVLVSGNSASASEIVAGALQDYDRAVLIGQRTFGKGLVQSTRQLSYNAQLKITTAKYYTPSGRCIQALDYSHRDKDGSVRRIADSVKTAFKTSNGRIVFDGGGLDPDVVVPEPQLGSAVIALIRSELMFDYATQYCATHAKPADLRSFTLTDADYADFLSFLKQKNFMYTTELESEVQQLLNAARHERYYDELATQLKQIEASVQQNHEVQLQRFRAEIQLLLEEEIAFHYDLNKGRTEVNLRRDPELLSALKLLADPTGYSRLLTPR